MQSKTNTISYTPVGKEKLKLIECSGSIDSVSISWSSVDTTETTGYSEKNTSSHEILPAVILCLYWDYFRSEMSYEVTDVEGLSREVSNGLYRVLTIGQLLLKRFRAGW